MAMAVTMETMLLLRLLLIVANECVQFLLRQVGVAFPIRMSHQSALQLMSMAIGYARAHRLPNWAALDHLRVSKIPFLMTRSPQTYIVFVAGIQILACSLIALLQSEGGPKVQRASQTHLIFPSDSNTLWTLTHTSCPSRGAGRPGM